MYTLLSYLPQVLAKTPLARYVKKFIFDPLGLNYTTYSFDLAKSTGLFADALTRQGVNFSQDPFGDGTVRVVSYDSATKGGEDGNGTITLPSQFNFTPLNYYIQFSLVQVVSLATQWIW